MECAMVAFSGGGLKFWLEAYSTATQTNVSFTPKVLDANVSAVIKPKGNGALLASIPDGTATGGNARGAYAVDLQMARANQERIATGAYSVISGGYSNRIHPQAGAYGIYCAIGGGNSNDCYGGNASTIAGGASNRTAYDKCFIGGGTSNLVNANHGVVSGGQSNTVGGDTATIGGGSGNTASANYAFIGGGQSNTASGAHSVAVGGQTNTASGQHSFVGGGSGNTASARYNIVVGGESNVCSGANQGNFIGGGKFNSLGPFAQDAVLVGGRSNSVSGGYAFLGSGNINSAGGDRSAVVSGTGNSSSGYHSFVGDGAYNLASGSYSAIVCGGNFDTNTDKNTASGTLSFVGNGRKNVASGTYAFVGNGFTNVASQLYSIVVGGSTNTASGYYNFIGGGFTNSGTANAAVTTQATTTVTSGSTAVTLSGANANIKIGQYITGTGIASDTYVANISGTTLTLSQNATASGTPTLSFFTPHGVVVGGGNNQATGSYSFIGGGGDAGDSTNRNTASGDWSTISGGRKNTSSSTYTTIGGGQTNTASGTHSTVSGGANNSATGSYSSILGGLQGVSSLYGQQAHASGQFSANGDAQAHELIWRAAVTGTTTTELFLDGASVRAILPATNTVWKGIINIAAVCTNAGGGTTVVGDVAAIDYTVTVKRIAGNTVLVAAAANITGLDSDLSMATSAFTIAADNATEALTISYTAPATADATTVIRVVATFRGLQIQY